MDTSNTQEKTREKIELGAFLSLVCACIFFSGIFASNEWWGVFDFSTMKGSFGKLVGSVTLDNEQLHTVFTSFRGRGGSSAADGFLFAVTLFPAVMFAIAMVTVFEYYGALKAAGKLMTPILRPILGLPGVSLLSLIATLQSTDAGAAMTRKLESSGEMQHKEVLRSCAFQMTSGGCLVNLFSSGTVLFALTTDGKPFPLAIGTAFILVLAGKFLGCVLMRMVTLTYLKNN